MTITLMTNITAPELTIVIPTLNESGNIAPLLERLRKTLHGIAWEVLFVDDDSTDDTRTHIAQQAQHDTRVRLLHRIGRRGLSSACVEGMLASVAPVLAVMDADLQHDETLLPKMLDAIKTQQADLVVGSRYMQGGDIGQWSRTRARISQLATLMGRKLAGDLTDPMSGFFMIRRNAFDLAVRNLSAIGFKILLDIVASAQRPLKIVELPFSFGQRVAGESKLDASVSGQFVMLLLDKWIGHIVPVRFVMFSAIGLLGLGVHLAALWVALNMFHLPFAWAQGVATLVAIFNNFALNNVFTFRDKRLHGLALVRGFIIFLCVCAVGAMANVGVAAYLFGTGEANWWLAGIAGAAMSAVWNYAVTSVLTWRNK
jgi:dolichol-phosphate mannosyltransferase